MERACCSMYWFKKTNTCLWSREKSYYNANSQNNKKDRKNYIKAMAQGLYPNAERITLATSDAVLIAHCAMEKHLSQAKG